MQNPYATPHAAVEDIPVEAERYEPRIFTADGRIGRLRYLAYSAVTQFMALLVLAAGAAAVVAVVGTQNVLRGAGLALLILLYLPVIIAPLVMARRRLNDLDKSGWLLLLMLVPIVNLVLALYLLFWPGSPGPNRYGLKPVPNSWSLIVGFLLPVILIGVLAAIAAPALQDYQDYLLREQAARQAAP